MKLIDVEEKIYDLASMFFHGVTVIWSEQMNTKPAPPFVELKCGPIHRTAFPVVDDALNRVYHERTILEVNLYTKGRPVNVEEHAVGNYINTATSDLMDFAYFIESDEITDRIAGWGMDVSLNPPVRDLTDLQNDSRYRYRAMAEFTVSFAQEAGGPFGLRNESEYSNSSGGGTDEQVHAEDYVIEDVDVKEE